MWSRSSILCSSSMLVMYAVVFSPSNAAQSPIPVGQSSDDATRPARRSAVLQQHLRHLRGESSAGHRGDNENALVVCDELQEFCSASVDRQLCCVRMKLWTARGGQLGRHLRDAYINQCTTHHTPDTIKEIIAILSLVHLGEYCSLCSL